MRAFAMLCCLTFAAPLHAAPIKLVVDPSGSADFTTIGAAVANMAATQAGGYGIPDTIVINPGIYLEDVLFPELPVRDVMVVCPGGIAATSLTRVLGSGVTHSGNGVPRWRVSGLTVTDSVDLDRAGNRFDWSDCLFESGFRADGSYSEVNMRRCEFRGPTELVRFYNHWNGATITGFEELVFRSAPLVAANVITYLTFDRCTFIGPVDQAARIRVVEDVGGGFRDCVFDGVHNGVQFDPVSSEGFLIERCLFQNLTGTALRYGVPSVAESWVRNTLYVSDTRFENCAKPVHWEAWPAPVARFDRDTVLASVGTAIDAMVSGGWFRGVVVEGAGGAGIRLRHHAYPYRPGQPYTVFDAIEISNCRVRATVGDGISLEDSLETVGRVGSNRILDCVATGAGGTGIRVQDARTVLARNVTADNAAHGISLVSSMPGYEDSLISNTSVHNSGDGIRLGRLGSAPLAPQVTQRNITAFNLGAGLRTQYITTPYPGSVAFNDAWYNASGQYVGVASPADSNLTADPAFCDLATGDFTLHADSPCAPSGVHGAVGAKGVGCAATLASGPVASVAFTISPNPARGDVAFRLPNRGGDGTLEVIDLQGRTVWSQRVRADGGSVHWSGSTTNGPLQTGLYWARFTQPGESRTLRMTWLH